MRIAVLYDPAKPPCYSDTFKSISEALPSGKDTEAWWFPSDASRKVIIRFFDANDDDTVFRMFGASLLIDCLRDASHPIRQSADKSNIEVYESKHDIEPNIVYVDIT